MKGKCKPFRIRGNRVKPALNVYAVTFRYKIC